jgi:hypothetical protein
MKDVYSIETSTPDEPVVFASNLFIIAHVGTITRMLSRL